LRDQRGSELYDLRSRGKKGDTLQRRHSPACSHRMTTRSFLEKPLSLLGR